MCILGIGTDIIHIPRITKLYTRYPEKLPQRLLSPLELHSFTSQKQAASFLAKRFAAKEALVKALGTGFRYNIRFRDITITNDVHGKPSVLWSGVAEEYVIKAGVTQTLITLADEKDYAIAYATLLVS